MFLQGMIGLRVSHVLEVVPPDRLWYLENWRDRVDSLVPYHHRHMFIWRFPEIGVFPVIIHFCLGFSMKESNQLLGYPHDYGNPCLWWADWDGDLASTCPDVVPRCRPPMSISQKGLWFISGFIGFRSHGGSPSHHRFQYDIKWPSMTWMICGIPMTSDSPISCENH